MASDGNSVTVFGDLSKPATVLIEKISGAVGILFEPKRITRKAHAESEAKKISALAELELTSELEQRAMTRLVHQEARKQKNIEDITSEAIAALPHDAKPENLDEDWIALFFKECEVVSDKEMQSLWSKLLAFEATVPGTFSKRTISCVSAMSKRDAELFTNLCQFCWDVGGLTPLVFDEQLPIYKDAGVTFTVLRHLEAVGLVTMDEMVIRRQERLQFSATYFDSLINFDIPEKYLNRFPIGSVLLTSVGRELAPICGAKPNEHFMLWILQKWTSEGCFVHSPYPRVMVCPP